jgi:hypothetical protein
VSLTLTVLDEELAVCRLPASTPLPDWADAGGLTAAIWTAEHTSIVCRMRAVPEGVVADGPWRPLMVAGPLDLGLTGILLSIVQPLADAGVGIFAVSTYDTDYVLVKQESLDSAVTALSDFGHRVLWP